MAYHDVRLMEDIERGAMGGPEFKTTIVELGSGAEQRNIDWSNARAKWGIGYGVDDRDYVAAIRAFFYARQGRAHTFPFRDWTDYQLSNELIGIGGGSPLNASFQIIRTYTSGSFSYVRRISRPVVSTLVVRVDGVVVPAEDYTVVKGLITFDTPPGTGDTVHVDCDFDIPVRFDTDHFQMRVEAFFHGAVPSLPIVEDRDL